MSKNIPKHIYFVIRYATKVISQDIGKSLETSTYNHEIHEFLNKILILLTNTFTRLKIDKRKGFWEIF